MRRNIASFSAPFFLVILALAAAWKWPDGKLPGRNAAEAAFLAVLPFLPYAALGLSLLLGIRWWRKGVVLYALWLGFAYWLVGMAPGALGLRPVSGPFGMLNLITPINLLLFSSLDGGWKQRKAGTLIIVVLSVEAMAALLWIHPWGAKWMGQTPFLIVGAVWDSLPKLLISCGVWSGVLATLLLRAIVARDAIFVGFFGSAVCIPAADLLGRSPHLTALFFFTAGLVLLAAMMESFHRLAYVDELTGLPGRRGFNEMVNRLGRRYVVAMIDIDHFKKFNDRYGHKTGDQVLRMIGVRLNEIGGGARTFRYGGEEFTAVFPGKTVEGAMTHLERCRRSIESTPFMVRAAKRSPARGAGRGSAGGRSVKVTVSIGVAGTEGGVRSPWEVVKAADKKLYTAKRTGRNKVAA